MGVCCRISGTAGVAGLRAVLRCVCRVASAGVYRATGGAGVDWPRRVHRESRVDRLATVGDAVSVPVGTVIEPWADVASVWNVVAVRVERIVRAFTLVARIGDAIQVGIDGRAKAIVASIGNAVPVRIQPVVGPRTNVTAIRRVVSVGVLIIIEAGAGITAVRHAVSVRVEEVELARTTVAPIGNAVEVGVSPVV